MGKYTIQLRTICDLFGRQEVESWFTNYNLENYLLPSQIQTINKNPLWTKQKLAEKIVDHYFMREIGLETPALFKHYAKVTMQEIMGRYLPIIYTNAIEYDPLVNVDFTETFEREINGNAVGNVSNESSGEGSSNSSSDNTASGLGVNSDTPQGQINKQNILQGKYASKTNADETESHIEDETNTQTSSSSSTDSTSQTETTESSTLHKKGNDGSLTTVQNLIKQFRDIISSTDEKIINELNSLFMGIY
ncbi:MAG: hypothetical protein J6T23_05965 [Elusimicrobia bacterium]|nr:hypothetical protein [Elusimicrobiota bacterium]